MGQKKNSKIFSLSLKNAEWESKYIEKNIEESSSLLHKNVEARNYLTQIFKLHGLTLHSCAIDYTQKSINFFILFFEKKNRNRDFLQTTFKKAQKKKNAFYVNLWERTFVYKF